MYSQTQSTIDLAASLRLWTSSNVIITRRARSSWRFRLKPVLRRPKVRILGASTAAKAGISERIADPTYIQDLYLFRPQSPFWP